MTRNTKIQRQKLWHDVTIIMSIAIISVLAGVMFQERLFAAFEKAKSPNPIHEIQYHIASGDTLWLLAGKVIQPDEDIRDKVIAIRNLNGLTPTQALIPGQMVKIPVKRLEDLGMRYTFRDLR